jgi:hypothetical protein
MLHSSVRSFGLVAATILAALQWFPSGSSDARAACGDYVHLGRGGTAASGLNADGVNSVTPPASLPHSRESSAPPCRGASCRQWPPSPTAPAPAPVSNGGDQKACLASAAQAVPSALERIFPEAAVPSDDGAGPQIERPPRHSS